jgi:hypothetical protein
MSGMMIAGSMVSAYGQLRQGLAEKHAHEFNAEVLGQKIKEEEVKAEVTADKIRARKRRMRGIQTALYMKAGVRIEGTPLEVLADTAVMFEQDLAMVDYNKRLALANLRMGIGAQKIAAKEAMTAACISATATALGGAAVPRGGASTPRQSSYGDWETGENYSYWRTQKSSYYG